MKVQVKTHRGGEHRFTGDKLRIRWNAIGVVIEDHADDSATIIAFFPLSEVLAAVKTDDSQ